MSPPNQIDLSEMFGRRASIAVEPEESAEAHTARIKKESREATFEIVKSYVLFFLIVAVMLVLGSLFIYEAVFDKEASLDTKRLAWGAVVTLFTSCVSFILGQRTAKK